MNTRTVTMRINTTMDILMDILTSTHTLILAPHTTMTTVIKNTRIHMHTLTRTLIPTHTHSLTLTLTTPTTCEAFFCTSSPIPWDQWV